MATIIETMRQVAADCKHDAEALDGQPFTGRVVAETFGNTLAMLAVVATSVEMLAAELATVRVLQSQTEDLA